MKVSNYISNKISILSLLGIIFVVFIHSTILNVENFRSFFYTQAFLRSIWNSFYPMFFTISGFLFFIGFKGEKKDFINKYKSRFKSLVIPYVFWNLSFLLLMLLLKYNPLTSSFINSNISELLALNVVEFFYKIFIIPFGFHLWFIRDLIVLVILAPVIWFCIKKIGYYLIPLLVVVDLLLFNYVKIGSIVPFAFGAILALKKINIEKKISKVYVWILFFLTIIFAVLRVVFDVFEIIEFYIAWVPFLFIWFVYDYLLKSSIKIKIIKKVLPFTFFIYVFHEPYLNIFKKGFIILGDQKEFAIWFSYFLSPITTIILAILIAKVLLKIFPNFYKIIVGGRIN